MPTVTKQQAKPTSAPARKPMLASPPPSNGDDELTGLKVSLYGRSKTGKTRLTATFPKPLLILGAEDGTKSIAAARKQIDQLPSGAPIHELLLRGQPTGIHFVRLLQSSWLDDATRYLASSNYRTACLDTASSFQDLVLKELLGLDEVPVQKSWGLTTRDTWMQCGTQVKERLRALMDLSDRSDLNVVIIAQERNFTEEGTGSDLVMPTVGSALTPSVTGWLNAAADYICQTFIRQGVKRTTQSVNGQEVTLEQPGANEYCLRTGSHPVYQTGFRLPPGTVLPDVIVDPTYGKVAALIRGE